MSYKVLSLKWRPTNFKQVVGQGHITKALSNAIKLNRLAHAFTFSGPRGVGKTTTARILAKTLNQVEELSQSLDIVEMDAASNRGIDDIRVLRENINYAPVNGKYKIYIIDEAHMLTKEAFNAFLKTLEEPPEHVVFIFATTELHKMPETIISRTQRYDFKRILSADIINQLKHILDTEKIKYELESLDIIANKSDGSMRDALSILDQMICYCDNNLIFNKVKEALGVVNEENYFELLCLIGKRKSNQILSLLHNTLDDGISVSDFILGFNLYLRDYLVNINSDANNKDQISLTELDLLRILELCLKFQINLKNFNQPKILLESLIIKLCYLDKTVQINKYLFEKNIDNEGCNEISDKSTVINDERQGVTDILEKDIKVDKDQLTKEKNNNEELKIIEDEKNEENDKDIDNKNLKNIDNSNDSNVTIDMVRANWTKILDAIQEKSSKTATFMENTSFEKIENGVLYLIVEKVNEFAIKSLNRDKKDIMDIINLIMNTQLNIIINYNVVNEEEKDNKSKNLNDVSEDQENPLVLDALNKFKGEIIK